MAGSVMAASSICWWPKLVSASTQSVADVRRTSKLPVAVLPSSRRTVIASVSTPGRLPPLNPTPTTPANDAFCHSRRLATSAPGPGAQRRIGGKAAGRSPGQR
jgi:hypothetical protein